MSRPWPRYVLGMVDNKKCARAETASVGRRDVEVVTSLKDIWRLGLHIHEITVRENMVCCTGCVAHVWCEFLHVDALEERWPD